MSLSATDWVQIKALAAYRKAGLAVLNRRGRKSLAVHGYTRLFDDRPANAKPPIWSDLAFLYRSVRERRPKVIVEFGSGCSTVIQAQALADNAAEGAPGFLYSLEADARWGEVTRNSLSPYLREHCELIVTPAIESDLDGLPVWRYRDVPEVTPDLVYLDGPALTPDRWAAVDVLDMEPRFPPGFRLVVDGRYRNCDLLEQHFRRRYRRKRRIVLKHTVYDLID